MAEEQQQQDPRNFVNIFTQGVLTDIDHINFPQGKYKDAKNIELIDRDGQGFVVTLQDGNEQFFSLNTGFKPVGSCFINGILYIFSVNDGVTEIGCFPSPKTWSKNNTEFQRVYKPLNNFTPYNKQSNRWPLRTELIPIANNRLLDVRAKQVYDGSVNLYFTDGVNPLRVINTGFDQEGRLTNKTYLIKEFENIISVIRGASGQMNVSLVKYLEGGRWKSGNTFLYVRYISEDFNKTNFLGESHAIPFNNYPIKAGVPGSPGTHAIDDYTSKAFEIDIKNIDTSYKFLEIAFIRYYSEENGIEVKEQKLINNRYVITGGTQRIRLNGFESFIDIDFEEIIKPNNQENVCETIEIAENRLWGANWKRDKVHDDSLAQFALGIKPYPKRKTFIKKYSESKVVGHSYGDQSMYSILDNYKSIGYFRGETYLFNAFFVYDDGSESLGYPTSGYDFFNLGESSWGASIYNTGSLKNQKGVIRFPSTKNSNPYYIATASDGGKSIHYYVLGLEFQFDKTIELPSNVVGFYLARAKRIPNLITQGISFNSYVSTVKKSSFPPLHQDSVTAPYQDKKYNDYYTMSFTDIKKSVSSIPNTEHGYWGMSQEYDRNASRIHPTDYNMGENKIIKTMPFYKGYYPIISYWDGGSWAYSMCRAFKVKGHYGIFSPDYMLDPTKKMNSGVLSPVGKVTFYDPYLSDKNQPYDKYYRNLLDDGQESITSSTSQVARRRYNDAHNGYGYPRLNLLEQKSVEFYNSLSYKTPEDIENVEKYTTPTKARKFVSWYKDAGLNNNEAGSQGDESMVYGVRGSEQLMCNRTMVTPRYFGVILNSIDSGNDYDFNIINSYHYNPESIEYDILQIYNYENESFSKVSDIEVLSKSNQFSRIEVFNGDCFLQTSYIKIMGHSGSTLASSSNEFAGDDGSFKESFNDRKHIGHGVIAMFVTENSINTELRIPKGVRTFFPFEPDPAIHGHINSENKEVDETNILNYGYHKILPPRTLAAYNFQLPETMDLFPNRVRYSNKNIPGSYIDAFSTFEFLSYKDFDVSSGEIKRLFNLSGWLIGVCENSLLSFYINSNQVKADPSADNILLGVSDILHENARTLANLGSQHFSGSINTGRTVVGLDWINKSIFSVLLQSSENGGMFPVAVNKSQEHNCKKYVEDVISQESGLIVDKTNMLRDLPWNIEGVYCSIDNGRVFISIHGESKVSFVYNENLDMIVGKSDFVPHFASNIGKSLISWNGNNQAWITTKDAPKSTYFGTQYESYVQSIVNPLGIFEKVYDALVLHVPDSNIDRIEYETETQQTVHEFPVGKGTQPWQDPVYKEHKLYVPTYPERITFYGKTRRVHLRGTWLAIKVVFDRQTPTFLKNIFTKFRISKS